MEMTTVAAGNPDLPADIAATLVDPAAYADQRIHDAYRWLRANNPLGIARPETVRSVLGRHQARPYPGDQPPERAVPQCRPPDDADPIAFEERVRKITGGPNLVRSLVQMDAPDHPKYRALTQGWFMPANLGKFEAAHPRDRARAPWIEWRRAAARAISSPMSRSAIRCT